MELLQFYPLVAEVYTTDRLASESDILLLTVSRSRQMPTYSPAESVPVSPGFLSLSETHRDWNNRLICRPGETLKEGGDIQLREVLQS